MKKASPHPDWATRHRKPGTELKLINGRYYLYGVKSVYDKKLKRGRKVSLGIIGSITREKGFVPSEKQRLRALAGKSRPGRVFAYEYGFSRWLIDTLRDEGMLEGLQNHFPDLWQFIVLMVFCRTAYRSPLKNIAFHCGESSLCDLLEWKEEIYDQKVSGLLFELGSRQAAIHEFIRPRDNSRKTVLMDATDIALDSEHIKPARKGYNPDMGFQPRFVLLYMYDARSLEPLYYRLLPGNIREASAMQNTIRMSGMEQCVYIADKGFFSAANVAELGRLGMRFVIPLRRDNRLIEYSLLDGIEQTENYFAFSKRFIFYADPASADNRHVCLFLDGRLRENEKTDYLDRIKTAPESYSKEKFNRKIGQMGTLAIMHNTEMTPEEVYREYKNRGETEQFFDHLKNTLAASSSSMQREESLNGWMFINHLSMTMIYKLYHILKTTPLNKKQMLNHKYSINDTIDHLKCIKRINYAPGEYVVAERNKSTKTLLEKMKISIT